MTDKDTVTCSHCGSQSNDPEWCDVCGGELLPDAAELPWFEVGNALTFELNGAPRMARAVDLLESYATRRILFARLCPEGEEGIYFTPEERGVEPTPKKEDTDEDDSGTSTGEFPPHSMDWPMLMLEESVENRAMEPDVLSDAVRGLVHLPIGRVSRSDTRYVEIYEAPRGVPLQDHLESLGRLLTLEEAVKLTSLLIEAVKKVHKAGMFHFQICPWTLHLSPKDVDTKMASDVSLDALQITFEGIRGFYDASLPVESHPVIMGFSPPEFFGRAPGPLDHRADIFGAGMLFYYLLSGSPPPTGTLTGHVPCLPVRAFRFELAPGMQSFVDGCTAHDPADRYESLDAAMIGLEQAHEIQKAREIVSNDNGEPGRLSLFCAVDRHIGIGKGRRTPINQDAVFLGHDPALNLALIGVGDGVSTASFGSGDIASALFVDACSNHWAERFSHLTPNTDPPVVPTLDAASNDMLAPRSDDSPTPEPDEHIDSMDADEVEDSAVLETIDAPEEEPPAAPLDTKTTEIETLEKQAEAEGEEPKLHDPRIIAMDETLDMDLSDVAAIIEAATTDPGPAEVAALASTLDGESPNSESPSEDEEEPFEDFTQGRLNLVGERANAPRVDSLTGRMLTNILEEGNRAISAFINARFAPFVGPVHEVMGTTAVTTIIQGDQVTLASLGDSRAYLLRGGHMECLTRDHNLATMRIVEGFSPDESLSLPQGSALARCLGTFEVDGGTLESVNPEPDLMTFRMLPGDVLLLATDGLVDFAGPTEATAERNIKAVLESEEIPSLACLRLMLLANEGGGEDNIGVAVIRAMDYHPGQRMEVLQAFPPVDALRQ